MRPSVSSSAGLFSKWHANITTFAIGPWTLLSSTCPRPRVLLSREANSCGTVIPSTKDASLQKGCLSEERMSLKRVGCHFHEHEGVMVGFRSHAWTDRQTDRQT